MRPKKLTVHNDPSATGTLRATLDEIADEYPLPSAERFELKVAATEALANALRGTPEGDPVQVRIVPGPDAIEVEVADRGVFAPTRGPDDEGGRGIPLMLALVDEVEFSCGAAGTRVRMRKRIRRASEEELNL